MGSYVFDDGTELRVGDGHIGPHTRKVYEALTGIQRGKRPAPEGWLFLAKRLEASGPAADGKPPARRPGEARARPGRLASRSRR